MGNTGEDRVAGGRRDVDVLVAERRPDYGKDEQEAGGQRGHAPSSGS
jgi:hypothetical protein